MVCRECSSFLSVLCSSFQGLSRIKPALETLLLSCLTVFIQHTTVWKNATWDHRRPREHLQHGFVNIEYFGFPQKEWTSLSSSDWSLVGFIVYFSPRDSELATTLLGPQYGVCSPMFVVDLWGKWWSRQRPGSSLTACMAVVGSDGAEVKNPTVTVLLALTGCV